MTSSTTEKSSAISDFVSRLERKFSELRVDGEQNKEIDRAGRAILKRHAGKTLAEAHRALPTFFSLNPPEVWQNTQRGERDGQRDGHECAWLVATLYCSMKGRKGGSLPDEMRFLEHDGFSRDSLERRMARLLGCRSNEELAFRLRQAAKLLESQRRGLDWRKLFRDLQDWHLSDRSVQRRWANAFFRTTDQKTEESDTLKGNRD